MKLLVADNINYFGTGLVISQKKWRYLDFNIVIDIDAEFDHTLDATVWQNRLENQLRRINFRGEEGMPRKSVHHEI